MSVTSKLLTKLLWFFFSYVSMVSKIVKDVWLKMNKPDLSPTIFKEKWLLLRNLVRPGQEMEILYIYTLLIK